MTTAAAASVETHADLVDRLKAAAAAARARGDHRRAAELYTRTLEASGGAPDVVELLDRALDRLAEGHDPFCCCPDCERLDRDHANHELDRNGAVL